MMSLTIIKTKPVSVNEAYTGRRFASDKLADFKSYLQIKLPRMIIPEGKLSASYEFGLSSKRSDADNCVKALQDCLADCYGFDDKMIYEVHAVKKDVGKGEEYCAFEIKQYHG